MTRIEIFLSVIVSVALVFQVFSFFMQRSNRNKVVDKLLTREPSQQAIESINKLKVFNHFDEIAIMSDTLGTITYVNEAISKSLGWLPEQLIGEHVLKIIASQYANSLRLGMKKLNEVSEAHFLDKVLKVSLVTDEGKEVPVEAFITMHNDGAHPYLIGIVKDMSNYNATINAIEWWVKFYTKSMGIINGGCFNADVLKYTVTMDENMRRIFDLPIEEATVSIDVTTDRIFSQDRQKVADAVQKAIETGTGYEVEFRLVNDRKIRLVAQIITDAEGKATNIVGALRILS